MSWTASANVFPTPQVAASQSIESVTLDVPNERDKPMTGCVITAREIPNFVVVSAARGPPVQRALESSISSVQPSAGWAPLDLDPGGS